MKRVIDILIVLFLVFVFGSCSSVKTHAQNYTPKINANSTVTITKNWDLKGKSVVLPEGVTLYVKNGVIQNGTLVGNNTKLAGKSKGVFNKVNIEGSWNVPTISSSLFVDLSEDNALRNVMALTDTNVRNVVTIEKGNYSIKLVKNQETGIYVRSNTTLVLNGTIRLKPNAFTNYQVVEATGNNIVIKGAGSIIGDKDTHTGKIGEWGMGLDVARGNNVSISGLTIKDCWGDCIYVGNKSQNVTIDSCILVNGRRQGISVTSADDVHISGCLIKDIAGTNPEYAIDLEPNQNGKVTNVKVVNCRAINCKGGFLCWGGAKGAYIGSVLFDKCTVEGNSKKYPYHFTKVDNLTVNECTATQNRIFVEEVKNSKLTNNKVGNKTGSSIYNFEKCKPTTLK